MRTFIVSVTDLITYESPPLAVCMEATEVTAFAESTARDLLRAMPGLALRGMCIAVYDENELPISIRPLDRVQ